MAVGKESEVADADEAFRQDVEQKAAEELLTGKGHLPLRLGVGVILPGEGDLFVGYLDEPLVGQCHPMGY